MTEKVDYIAQAVKDLESLGVALEVDDGRLVYHYPAIPPPPDGMQGDIERYVRMHEAEVVAYLEERAHE
jgi:hypothetical protein